MNRTPVRALICLILLCIAVNAACAGRINMNDPIRLSDDQTLKAIYYFPHWWDPWKDDDAVVSADLNRMKELGFNTVCLDHEVSQAIDRDWYWLDREYRLAGREGMNILPWLQLQSVDRVSLMDFSSVPLRQAVKQDGVPDEDCVVYRDGDFTRALADYVIAYLDRYIDDPALLRVKDNRGNLRPVVGLMVEIGWRTPEGLPLSFDEETNDYFRRWMRSSHHDLNHLNSRWGTNYKSFDEIDPMDKTIFNYDFPDKQNMPVAVQDHANFRARLINDAMRDVTRQVKRRHNNVLFVAEMAYPYITDDPVASAYKWNNANLYRAIDFADMVVIRTMGHTSTSDQVREHNLMMRNGKGVILAYRFSDNCSHGTSVALALDCALSANGLAYYSWNELADRASTAYDRPERQALMRLMTDAYDLFYNTNARHDLATSSPLPLLPEQPVPAEVEVGVDVPTEEEVVPVPTETVEPIDEEELPPAPVLIPPATDPEADADLEVEADDPQIISE